LEGGRNVWGAFADISTSSRSAELRRVLRRYRNRVPQRVRDWVREQQVALTLSDEQFFGVGLGIAGFHVSGTSFNASLPLHEWSLIELGPLLTSYFERPVWALNGGKIGTVAESTSSFMNLSAFGMPVSRSAHDRALGRS